MKGLIIKDLLNLKKYLNTIIPFLLFYTFMTNISGDPGPLIGIIVMFLTMMSITSMSYDEFAKWDVYALSMPISRKVMVMSKYLLSLILSMSGVIVSTTIAYVLGLYKGNLNVPSLLLISYSLFVISILFVSVILPLIYKFGVEKSRLLMMAVMAVPPAIIYLLNQLGMPMPDKRQLLLLLKLSPLILLIFLFASISISNKIYKNIDL